MKESAENCSIRVDHMNGIGKTERVCGDYEQQRFSRLNSDLSALSFSHRFLLPTAAASESVLQASRCFCSRLKIFANSTWSKLFAHFKT